VTRKFANANSLPQVYYGLHMVEGVAEYAEPNQTPYRILIGEDTIKNMNPTFAGKPVYVDHVDEVDLENLQEQMDGVVVESFFNKADGKNWVKFVAISDRAKEAIRMGWKLSNAYVPKSFSGGGLWHGVEYLKEVTGGEYEHLAIVRNPRYEESMILTPEEFKKYNGEKEVELSRLTNSKEKETKMAFKLFKRQKVENSADFESMMIELPKSKKEMLLSDVVAQFDAIQNMNGYANGDHMVKVGDDEMSVNDLVKKHIEMQNKMKENAGEGEPSVDVEDVKENAEEAIEEGVKAVGDRGGDESLDNEEDDVEAPMPEKKKKNEQDKEVAKAKAAALKNAHLRADAEEPIRIETSMDQVARGKAKYGSA